MDPSSPPTEGAESLAETSGNSGALPRPFGKLFKIHKPEIRAPIMRELVSPPELVEDLPRILAWPSQVH